VTTASKPGAGLLVLAPADSPIRDWLRSAGFALSDAGSAEGVVFVPPLRTGEDPRPTLPSVACVPVDLRCPGDWFRAPNAEEFNAVLADAYSGDKPALVEAVRFALDEHREQRSKGALRITWLGSLGEERPAASPPIGTSVALVQTLLVGRSATTGLCLRHGPHSDQNTVARLHARFERTPTGATVEDLGSTNGTWLAGRRVEKAELRVGDEVAVAGTHRLRLDGDPTL